MADAEVKSSRGRKKAVEAPVVEAKKRPAPAAAESNGAPAKRGRGRPPKGSKKPKKVYVKKNDPLGRGRPPKNAPKKAAKKSSEEEEESA